ncbi:beta-ketoacyl-[acyl-carrier-protein] synthase family protein [Symbioplanes lichenis]|uniref:beta-ketoacyl-[acyl-carrier-protein] synthase family protein n=1 Tax=Symbioplanes lichenis TaxID=1629072 RepID=UPI002738A501|nr:beta-ketoacyl-[acyl-carrier-protein] synthase family protein [Actinoplanes lichenis]
MTVEVAVSGFGVFSAFGSGSSSLAGGVLSGRHGFSEIKRFDATRFRARYGGVSADAGPLADTFVEVAHEAVAMAGIDQAGPAAVLLGTQGDWTGLTRYWRHGETAGLRAATAAHHAQFIAGELGLGGERRRAFTNGCVAATTAIIQGCQLIAAGRERTVLAGGGYLVDEEFFAKFDSGRALTTASVVRPFSKGRTGLLLGDGVGVLVLEPAAAVRARGAEPLAIVAGWGQASDAYHVCRPHPDGAGMARAMTLAMGRAGASAADIDYVNAHGTGTPVNDPAETAALRAVFGDALPPVSSTKSMTGHALEGSGALEAVISMLALRDGVIPPTAGFLEPDADCVLDCVPNRPRPADLRQVMSVSAAFGGVNAALVLRRPG